jgi:protein-S-isoprenylcysteine O-methyltransferase Ste14
MPAGDDSGQDEVMHPVIVVIGIGWVIFWIAWLIAAFTAKASRGQGRGRLGGARIALAIVVVILFRANIHGGSERVDGPVLEGIGLALWIAGVALAVWARLYIGRNWGMPMSRREEPNLVTTGPYRFIRHPIYTGIILAMIGTALAISLFGLIVVAVIAAFFAYSASREERFLAEEFPATFPDYKARTKLLIPFVF